jgi:hypothetical protein
MGFSRVLRLRVFAACLFLSLGFAAQAQEAQYPFDATSIPLGPNARGLRHLADLDGDGDPDAIGIGTTMSTYGSYLRVELWRNDGTGALTQFWDTEFYAPNGLPGGSSAVGHIGDFDGREDAVATFGRETRILLSTGTSGAPLIAYWGSAERAQSVVVADFDLDGRGDIAQLSDTGIHILRYIGGGTFTPTHVPLTFGADPTMLTGDVNDDGIPDLIVVDANSVHLLPVAGGLPSAGTVWAHGIGMPMPTFGDVDGDGDGDIVVFGTSDYVLFRRTGPSSFFKEPLAVGGPATDLADVDGDGDLDGICCGGGGGGAHFPHLTAASPFNVSLNSGTGSFAPAFQIPGIGSEHVAGAKDMDGDGDVDLVAGRAIYFARGPITGPPGQDLPVQATRERMVDCDGDRDPDLQFGVGVHYRNLGDGTMQPAAPVVMGAPAGVTYGGPGYVGDFDGDGDQDLIVERFFGGFQGMQLLRNVGGGLVDAGPACQPGIQFSLYTTIDPEGGLVGDVDGDGDLDLITRSTGGPLWSHFWINDGTGFFVFSHWFDNQVVEAVADFTGDGIPDLIIAWGGLGIRLGLGGLAFQPWQQLTIGPNGGQVGLPHPFTEWTDYDPHRDSLDVADFDGDGLPDLAAVERTGGNPGLKMLHNLSAQPGMLGRFTISTLVLTGYYGIGNEGGWARFADVDSDGQLDVVAGNAIYSVPVASYVMLRSGPGASDWKPAVLQIMDGRVLTDMDGDGDPDLLGTRWYSNTTRNGVSAGGRKQYGDGIAGMGSLIPTLGASGPFRVGSLTELVLTGGLGGSPAVLVIGDQPTNVPFLGAPLYTNPVHLMPMALGGSVGQPGEGAWSLPFFVPPTVNGLTIYLQAGVADPAAISGISRTNGLAVTYGF